MDKTDIYELMDRFVSSGLQSMVLQEDDFSLELHKAVEVAPSAPAVATTVVATGATTAAVAASVQEEQNVLKAPLVGTYYASPSPQAEPFVQVGERVSKGQTLCLLEAMKTMSEIPAPCDLVVESLLANDGELVAFGAPILRYRHV